MRKLFFGILLAAAFGCKKGMLSAVGISPRHFKIQTPFMLNGRGIIVNTYWGTAKTHRVLCLDNHSPSWIKSALVHYDRSFRKSKDVGFQTSTADDTPLQGDVGICDSLFFENVLFRNVPFYVMPENPKDNKTDDGVFGIDAMSKGIWKIDFRKEELTFASAVDSVVDVSETEIFPAKFENNAITVRVDFGKNNVHTMAVDLGYNGEMLVPFGEFKNISPLKPRFTNLYKFATPASETVLDTQSILDTVGINQNWFVTSVSSNEKVTERLVGLAFFKRFNYIILDFVNKRLYIPKKVW